MHSIVLDIHASFGIFSLFSPLSLSLSLSLSLLSLHSVLATNTFVSKFNEMVIPECYFCKASDTVFHLFCECSRLTPLFVLSEKLIMKLGFSFTKTLCIFGCKYKQSWRERCVLANFLLGQAKLAILKTHQC